MHFLLSTLLLTLLQLQVFGQECCEEYCYGKDTEKLQTQHYATKTGYEVAKGPENGNKYKIEHCEPVKVWIMARHGTRWPTKKDISQMQHLEELRDEIIKNYEERKSQPERGGLCMDDKFSLKTWKLSKNLTTDTYAEMLAPQGYEDLKLIARHYKRTLNEIFVEPYDEKKYLFRYTPTQRTEASYKAFAAGLFEHSNTHPNVNPSPDVDPILNAYDGCSNWKDQNIQDKDNMEAEFNLFENSDIMNKTINDISRRLGFKFPLAFSQIQTIWDMCRYEQAWHSDRASAWCAAFTPSQVTVLEYAEDLKYYYKSGYGHELNSRVACSAVKDMVLQLNSSYQPQVISYFTHSANIQLFLTALGAAKDREALRSNNFIDMKNRNWMTSILTPFASNFAAIKYNCANEPKVMFVLNRNPINLEWCKVGLCNWGDALINFEKFINADCSDYYCNLNSSTTIQSSFLGLTLSLIIYFLLQY